MKKFVAGSSLLVFSTLVMGYLWWGKFQYHHRYWLAAVYLSGMGLVLANSLYYRDSRKALGLRFDNLGVAVRWYGGVTLLLIALIAGTGFAWGNLRLDRWSDLYLYFAWAGIQQFVLQNFLRRRGEALFQRSAVHASLLAGGLFAIYHLPNYALVALAFCGALLWCALYRRLPNFFCAWFSQAVLTTALLLFFKYGFLDQFQIGHPGHRYEAYGDGVQVAGGYDAHGAPFIVTLPHADQGRRSLVRIFDGQGRKVGEWIAFKEFDFSAQMAVGDLGFDPGDELAVAPGPGHLNPATIRIFDRTGNLKREFRAGALEPGYGVWLSIHCKKIYVCPGPGPGKPQQVLEFSSEGSLLNRWEFSELGLVNGVRAAAREHHLFLWGSIVSVNPSTVYVFDAARNRLSSWETFSTTYGLNAVPVHLGEERTGLAAAPGSFQGYPSVIDVFDLTGKKLYEFFAVNDKDSCGANLAAVDIDGDGMDELIFGEGACRGRPNAVRIYRLDGTLIRQWNAY